MRDQGYRTARRTELTDRTLSRRQLLRRLGVMAAAGSVIAAGAGIGTRLVRGPRVVVLPNGAEVPVVSTRDWGKLNVISRAAWKALPVDLSARIEKGIYEKDSNPYGWYVYTGALHDSYQTLVVHHSAFYKADGLATLREVQRLHRNDRGWADVGYHFLLDIDGRIYEGRDLRARGVHTQGHNTGSAGLCLLGDFRSESPPEAQWKALVDLGRWLVDTLRVTHIAGHSQFNLSTVCPGSEVIARLPELGATLGLEYGSDGYVPAARVGAGCSCCGCQSQL